MAGADTDAAGAGVVPAFGDEVSGAAVSDIAVVDVGATSGDAAAAAEAGGEVTTAGGVSATEVSDGAGVRCNARTATMAMAATTITAMAATTITAMAASSRVRTVITEPVLPGG